MATNRTVTVKSSGGDYASLNSALSTEAGNLVSLDRQLTIECYAFEDTTAVDTTGQAWTTDATRYVEIVAVDNHNGRYTSNAYRLSVTDGNVFLNPTVDHLYLTGLQFRQIRSASSGGLQGTLHFDGGLDVGVQQVDKCIIVLEDAASYTAHGIRVEDSSPTYNIRNTVIYGGSANSSSAGLFVNAGTAVVNCDNVTIDDCSDGIKFNTSNTTGVKLQNTRITGCTTVIDEGTGNIISGSNYNLTDGTAPTNWGANSIDSTDTPVVEYRDDSNTTLTSRDYHLNSYLDSGVGAGTDLSGTFTTDIDGVTRSSWDIGSDEYDGDRIVSVKSSGGTYASLNAAFTGETTYDCVTAGGDLIIECYNFEDTTACATTAITTDSTHRVIIRAVDDHGGKWSTSCYRMVGSTTRISNGAVNYMKISGLQFNLTTAGSNAQGYLAASPLDAAGLTEIEKIIVMGVTSATAPDGVWNSEPLHDIWIRNSIFYSLQNGFGNSGSGAKIISTFNTIDDCVNGFYDSYGSHLLKNTRITGCTNVEGGGGGTPDANSDYNLTDGTAPTNWGANSLDSTDTPTIDYVDDTNATLSARDYHIASTSDSGYQAGVDMSGDATYPVTDDIDGDTRS